MKTPEERGPLGAWAYETRVRLGLSVEQVAHALPTPVNPATIRKAEGESRNMSRPLWRALTEHYRRVARDRDIEIAQAPTYGEPAPTGDQAAIIEAIDRQTAMIERQAVAQEQTNALLEALLTRRARRRQTDAEIDAYLDLPEVQEAMARRSSSSEAPRTQDDPEPARPGDLRPLGRRPSA